MGTQVVVADQEGFDIVAFAPRAIRVEVKATARGAVNNNRLEFNTSKGGGKGRVTEAHCEVVALADLLGMRCLFFPISAVNRKNFKVSQNRFTPAEEAASWIKCIRSENEKNI